MSAGSDRDVMDVVLPRGVRIRVVAAVLGNAFASVIETGSMLLIVPLAELVSGAATETSTAHQIGGWLGISDHSQLMILFMGIVFVGFLIKNLFSLALQWWIAGFLNYQAAYTATELFNRMLRGPYEANAKRSLAEQVRAINDSVTQYYGARLMGTTGVITEAISVGLIIIALIVVAPLETLGLGAFFAIAGFGLSRLLKNTALRMSRAQLDLAGQSFQALIHGFRFMPELKVRRTYPHFVNVYKKARTETARYTRLSAVLGQLPKYVMETVFLLGIAGLLVFSVLSNSGGNLGTLAILVVAGFRLLPTINRLLASVTQRRSGAASIHVLQDEFTRFGDTSRLDGDAAATPLPLEHELALEEVRYRYPGADEDVLRGITLTVPRGTSLALAGASGSGKSTLINLLLGYFPPSAGRVLADGVDVSPRLAEWQRGISFVPQDVFLMDASLRENIAFDNDPQLLVLDEATSALDNETEHRITQAIEALKGRTTVIIVAHRLSTIRNADQVAYLDGGEIVTIGSFAEVAKQNPTFAELVRLGSLDITA